MSDPTVPPPTEAEANPPKWSDVSQAKAEEKNWTDEDQLKGVKVNNDILWHRVYGIVVVVLMVFLVLVFLASLGAWVIHYVTPFSWLDDEQLSKIQSVIFSGSLGAIVSSYMHRQLSK